MVNTATTERLRENSRSLSTASKASRSSGGLAATRRVRPISSSGHRRWRVATAKGKTAMQSLGGCSSSPRRAVGIDQQRLNKVRALSSLRKPSSISAVSIRPPHSALRSRASLMCEGDKPPSSSSKRSNSWAGSVFIDARRPYRPPHRRARGARDQQRGPNWVRRRRTASSNKRSRLAAPAAVASASFPLFRPA